VFGERPQRRVNVNLSCWLREDADLDESPRYQMSCGVTTFGGFPVLVENLSRQGHVGYITTFCVLDHQREMLRDINIKLQTLCGARKRQGA
jgi:hypothetical protein